MGAKQKGESGAAKNARAEYDRLSAEYKQKVAEYQNTVKENAGQAGYQKTLDMASQQAGALSQNAAAGAANAAQQAGRAAGQSKAAAAMNAMNAAGNQYANSYNDNFLNQQNQAAGQLSNLIQGTGDATNMFNNVVANQKQSYEMQQAADAQNQAAKNANSFWNRYAMPALQGASAVSSIVGNPMSGIGSGIGTAIGNKISGQTNSI